MGLLTGLSAQFFPQSQKTVYLRHGIAHRAKHTLFLKRPEKVHLGHGIHDRVKRTLLETEKGIYRPWDCSSG